jgi:nitrite reductase (NADH) large subunit
VSHRKTHTIIGNSAAALSAIKAIRKMADSDPIVLISSEDCPAYSPVLTTYYIGGQIKRTDLFLANDRFYKRFNVQTHFGHRAEDIDPVKRVIHLDNRKKLTYGDLLIATGASARPLKNVDPDASAYVTTLRTIWDADKIIKAVEKARDIVFVGAGLVSLQTIKAILGRGIKISLLVGSYQILSQQMHAEAAAIIQNKLEAEGVSIFFGRDVDRVIRMGDRVRVVTSFSEALPADLVIVGKGVQPNTEVVKQTEIRVGAGILVDDQMRTNLKDIYAAGDVAEAKNSITGQMEVIATWANACAQGETAGLNMAGCTCQRQGQFRDNVTSILGVTAASIGVSRPGEGEFREVSYDNEKVGVYRKLFLDNSRIVGAVLLGRTEDAGVIRHCIARGLDVSPWEEMIAMAPLDFGKVLFGQDFRIPFFRG